MGLGSFQAVSLARAREKAAAARAAAADGVNPIEAKRAERRVPTFAEVADEWIAVRSAEVRSAKSVQRYKRALEVHAAPLRSLPVNRITTQDVLGVLKPIWDVTPETAKNVRIYVEAVLDRAGALGHRSGQNPAHPKGPLGVLLPRQKRLSRGHHAAMDYGKVPAFIAELRSARSMSALALEFLVLTAARSGEVLGAVWSEIDLHVGTWSIPASRMKAGRPHRIPLSEPAVQILAEVGKARTERNGFVFPGAKPGRPLSNMAFEMLLRRMGQHEVTTHGFRSSFRDWAGDTSSLPREIVEAALAHSVGDQTERAYRRGDALSKRRELMEAWASYLAR